MIEDTQQSPTTHGTIDARTGMLEQFVEHISAQRESATYGAQEKDRVGFFTDTTLCIGCKACEVACKEWNELPADGYTWTGKSYDNTTQLSGDTWRHVAFVEQFDGRSPGQGRWLMESDVCKHCTHAACLDVCPTGAIIRSEFGTVVVQEDVCNGCGYCVSACPFGVVAIKADDGRAGKCTMCYDRLKNDEEPACAKACPTDSIQFGKLDELRDRAQERLDSVKDRFTDARLYLENADDGVGGGGAFFLLLDKPQVYGLPPKPIDPTLRLPEMWKRMLAVAGVLAAGMALVGIRK
jgi:formate dehydrogenase iron-sulfur subunit